MAARHRRQPSSCEVEVRGLFFHCSSDFSIVKANFPDAMKHDTGRIRNPAGKRSPAVKQMFSITVDKTF